MKFLVVVLCVACLVQVPPAMAEDEESLVDGRMWATMTVEQKLAAIDDAQEFGYFIGIEDDHPAETYVEWLDLFYADAVNERVELWEAMDEVAAQLNQAL